MPDVLAVVNARRVGGGRPPPPRPQDAHHDRAVHLLLLRRRQGGPLAFSVHPHELLPHTLRLMSQGAVVGGCPCDTPPPRLTSSYRIFLSGGSSSRHSGHTSDTPFDRSCATHAVQNECPQGRLVGLVGGWRQIRHRSASNAALESRLSLASTLAARTRALQVFSCPRVQWSCGGEGEGGKEERGGGGSATAAESSHLLAQLATVRLRPALAAPALGARL